jgi:hypothetical protein
MQMSLLSVAIAAAGFIAASAIRTSLWAEGQPRGDASQARVLAQIEAERLRPRFTGEIGGIFLAPQGTTVPERYVTNEDICGSNPSNVVPWDDAGELDLHLQLPSEYRLLSADMDTVVVECGGTVFNARRKYEFRPHDPKQEVAEVIIGRVRTTNDEVDVAVDRPKVMTFAGSQVVVIEPITEDGKWQTMEAYMPEAFGGTFVHAYNMPRADFLTLVELVASNSR